MNNAQKQQILAVQNLKQTRIEESKAVVKETSQVKKRKTLNDGGKSIQSQMQLNTSKINDSDENDNQSDPS